MQPSRRHFAESLSLADIRLFIGSVAFFTLASRALAVVVGFQIYKLTRSALALGFLGLVEAIPAISLVLFGGYVADHFNRRKILLVTRSASFACAVAMALLSLRGGDASVAGLYGAIFLAGVARGFSEPAASAFEAQVVPRPLTVNASSWISSTWITCSVLGPAAVGFLFEGVGAAGSYLAIAVSFALSWACMLAIGPKVQAPVERPETVLRSIGTGWRFVLDNKPLLAAMGLDLFAVLFGGAIALLPIYAEDILHVGAGGLGLLNAAPSLGAVLTMLIATHHPPIRHAGRNLLWVVAGFGVSILVFAFSKHFWLSMAALLASGAFDGVSVIIRRSMLRLLTPDPLRGRVAAANSIFICASNELGAFESGLLAAWIGVVPCVAAGGVATLAIVAAAAVWAVPLRRLRFDPHTMQPVRGTDA